MDMACIHYCTYIYTYGYPAVYVRLKDTPTKVRVATWYTDHGHVYILYNS